MDEWVAFFRVKEQREALKWQVILAAMMKVSGKDWTDYDFLQNLDFDD